MITIANIAALVVAVAGVAACSTPSPAAPPPRGRHLVLVTIDTLRADRVGVYGDGSARTPNIDAVAQRGVRYERAFATAPITLTSHASMMTGLYPAGHAARHNGLRIDGTVPTLAGKLAGEGFATAAFVGAFPLDKRFGLNRGFAVYDDTMPRDLGGRTTNERPGQVVVDRAIAWIEQHRARRMFAWVHLFEPHAPYGNSRMGGSVAERYAEEIAEADRQIGRLVAALGSEVDRSIVVIAADHGEAFGEHGEVSHSIFVYDTTLRVPFAIAGPGVPARVESTAVSVIDLAPTALALLGITPFDSDGIDLTQGFAAALPARELYAESYAPMLDFGWSPLRTVRAGNLKYIAAPQARSEGLRPSGSPEELYDVDRDPGETRDLASTEASSTAALRGHVNRYGSDRIASSAMDAETRSRLQALGYVSGSGGGATRADPKDRRELARALAEALSGELQGAALEAALRRILRQDPGNSQAHLRLGHLLVESNQCAEAVGHLQSAIRSGLPGADAHLDLAFCQIRSKQLAAAIASLTAATGAEPDNPVVLANLGILLSEAGRHSEGVAPLRRALELDPGFNEARFNLARVLAHEGRKDEARREAEKLLKRLPPGAPQEREVRRMIDALR